MDSLLLALLFSTCKIKFFSPSDGRALLGADGETLFDHLIALAPEGEVPLHSCHQGSVKKLLKNYSNLHFYLLTRNHNF